MIQLQVKRLKENLESKEKYMDDLIQIAQVQKNIDFTQEQGIDEFDYCIQQKEGTLSKLVELTREYDVMEFTNNSELKSYLDFHKEDLEEIRCMNQKIATLTTDLKSIEQECKESLEAYIILERSKIKKFRINNQTTTNYSKNMNGLNESFFMDHRK